MNNLYIIAAKSGAGKDHVADKLCQDHNLKKVISYTTRKKRKNEENTHIFVSKKEFNTLRNDLIAYTLFNGNEYGATRQQADESDIYIVDKKGIEYLKKHYTGNKQVKVIYISVPENVCRLRMIQRGDDHEAVNERIANDAIEFQGIESISDVIIPNNYFNSCVCDIWEYIRNCEGSDGNK